MQTHKMVNVTASDHEHLEPTVCYLSGVRLIRWSVFFPVLLASCGRKAPPETLATSISTPQELSTVAVSASLSESQLQRITESVQVGRTTTSEWHAILDGLEAEGLSVEWCMAGARHGDFDVFVGDRDGFHVKNSDGDENSVINAFEHQAGYTRDQQGLCGQDEK